MNASQSSSTLRPSYVAQRASPTNSGRKCLVVWCPGPKLHLPCCCVQTSASDLPKARIQRQRTPDFARRMQKDESSFHGCVSQGTFHSTLSRTKHGWRGRPSHDWKPIRSFALSKALLPGASWVMMQTTGRRTLHVARLPRFCAALVKSANWSAVPCASTNHENQVF